VSFAPLRAVSFAPLRAGSVAALVAVSVAALVAVPAVASPAPSSAQERDRARLVEGPPDAGVVIEGVESALDLVVAGDKAWREGQRDVAFDAWRSAIEASAAPDSAFGGGTVVAPPAFVGSGQGDSRSPGADVDGTLARRAEDCAWTVRRRLNLLGDADRAAWSERFDALSLIQRRAAGDSGELLTRVQREFPLTRGAARAALALCDEARERAQPTVAEAWWRRAASDILERDLELARALKKRTIRVVSVASGSASEAAPSLRLERVVELGPRPNAGDAAIPGVALSGARILVALGADGQPLAPVTTTAAGDTTWFHGGGRLLRFDGEGRATAALDVLASLRQLGAQATPGFSEPDAPWDEAFAIQGDVLALVEGRAREDEGNAIVGIEGGESPRVAWVRDSHGLVVDGARVEAPDLARAPALLEFQPGPVLAGDTLVVHVRAWPRTASGDTVLDEARVEAWCAGLDPQGGALRWSRRIATGSTLRGSGRGRMLPAEPTTQPALGLALTFDGAQGEPLGGARVAVDTGLGAIAVLDAVDGRVCAIVKASRSGARPAAVGGVVNSAGASRPWWFAPAQSEGALLQLRAGPDLDGEGLFADAPLVLRGPRIPTGAVDSTWGFLTAAGRGVALSVQDVHTGVESRSVALPFASLELGSVAFGRLGFASYATAGGAIYAFDGDLRLQAELELGRRADFARVALAAAQGDGAVGQPNGVLRVASPNRIAFVSAR
jgi:hypothetical protein